MTSAELADIAAEARAVAAYSETSRQLANLHQHAETLRALILDAEHADEKPITLHILRAIVRYPDDVGGEVVSLKVEKANNPGHPGVPRFNGEVLRFAGHSGQHSSAVRISSSIGLQAEELAVFFGLHLLSPEQVHWTDQTVEATMGVSEYHVLGELQPDE
jgi:hypothetical protein